MQTIAAAAVMTYYLAVQSAEYYLSSDIPGRIVGSAAPVLGIPTEATPDELANLFRGVSPDGKKSYVQQQGYHDVHRGCRKVRHKAAGWDATWSVPKSVSVLWAIAPAFVRNQIEEAVRRAVEASVAYLEQHAAFTRRGQGGSRRERVSLIVGTFTHASSRAGDPQLHVHGVIFNIGLRRDGTTGTIVSKTLYQHQKASGALFRAALANELHKRLKLSILRTRHGFEIKGVPQNVIRGFSKRRQVIEAELAKRGEHSPKVAARVTLATRDRKTNEPSLADLRARWRQEAASLGFTYTGFEQLRIQREEEHLTPQRFAPIIESAKDKLTSTHDVFTERDVVQHTLDASVSTAFDVDFVMKATNERLGDRRDFVELKPDGRRDRTADRETMYVTRRTANDLADVERRIKRLSRDRSFIVRNDQVEKLITQFSQTGSLIVEEIKHHVTQIAKAARKRPTQPIDRKRTRELAAATLDPRWAVYFRGLVQLPGRVVVMQDWPSPLRDLALKVAAKAWSQSGRSVIACTRRLEDAAELQAGTGISTMTVRGFQLKSKPTLAFQLRWHATGLVRTALGAPTSRLNPPPLNNSKVLLVDRADHLRPSEVEMIVRESERHGAKIVFLTTPMHKQSRERNQATASLLDRFSVPTWKHNSRTWQPQSQERTTRSECSLNPEMEL
jgi:conjugative relaxase-like TrwC/TraI family protein